MGKVLSHMTMSLDGFIAQPDDQVGELFDWYDAGDIEVASANPDVSFSLDAASAGVWRELTERVAVLVSGRHLFDITDGWGDSHPADVRVVVVTHSVPDDAAARWPTTTFVADVADAIAQAHELAGEQDVVIASPTVTQQALELGLVDEVWVSLAPVLFGEGKSYFGELARGHVVLEDPVVVQGVRALHLRYPVRR